MKKITVNKIFEKTPLIVLLFVVFLTIGFAATSARVSLIAQATVTPEVKWQVSDFYVTGSTSDGESTYESDDIDTLTTGAYLPNDDSTITYRVDLINLGTDESGILKIDGLPDNLDIDITDYTLGDKLCSTDGNCGKLARKTFFITIKYKEGGRNPNVTTYPLDLTLDFRPFYSVTYKNIVGDYPSEIIDGGTLDITFVSDIPNDVNVTGANFNYNSPNLSIFDPTGDVVVNGFIYSRYYDELVFDGTNYIDTGISLFSEENIDKNFEISFEISVDSNQNTQATIINAMEEKSPYPGFVVRCMTNNSQLEFNSPKIKNKPNLNISTTRKIFLKRYNDVYYIQVNDGNLESLGTYSGTTFDLPLIIGASLDGSGNPWRYFKGTLTNVNIEVTDQETYTVKFVSNGGTGTMTDQIIRKEDSVTLKANAFEYDGHMFDQWNTKPDGSGTSYNNQQSVLNLANPNETITLYAIWVEPFKYTVNFNANGGQGSMAPQELAYATTQNLNTNTYTKANRTFVGWNTKADGSGTSYKDGATVKNLTKTANDTVNLYAMWAEDYYFNASESFTGSNYIDTEIHLFSTANINKNFEVSFEIVSRTSSGNQATMMSAMDESGSPWPGMVYRVQSGSLDEIGANVTTSIKTQIRYSRNDVSKVTVKRINGILYINLNDAGDEQILDMTSLTQTFDVPLTFGASLNASGNPQRYFTGALKDMQVILYE